jgi:hypothetical protein
MSPTETAVPPFTLTDTATPTNALIPTFTYTPTITKTSVPSYTPTKIKMGAPSYISCVPNNPPHIMTFTMEFPIGWTKTMDRGGMQDWNPPRSNNYMRIFCERSDQPAKTIADEYLNYLIQQFTKLENIIFKGPFLTREQYDAYKYAYVCKNQYSGEQFINSFYVVHHSEKNAILWTYTGVPAQTEYFSIVDAIVYTIVL